MQRCRDAEMQTCRYANMQTCKHGTEDLTGGRVPVSRRSQTMQPKRRAGKALVGNTPRLPKDGIQGWWVGSALPSGNRASGNPIKAADAPSHEVFCDMSQPARHWHILLRSTARRRPHRATHHRESSFPHREIHSAFFGMGWNAPLNGVYGVSEHAENTFFSTAKQLSAGGDKDRMDRWEAMRHGFACRPHLF